MIAIIYSRLAVGPSSLRFLFAMNGNFEIKDGEYTSTIYTLIKEQRYIEAINILNYIYDSNPTSRAALSLLAYCYYYMQVINGTKGEIHGITIKCRTT